MEAPLVDLTAAAAPSLVDLTAPAAEAKQDEDEQVEEEEELQFLGSVNFTIVGIRYYRGEAHPNEFVSVVREPENMYDRNAIKVNNMHGEKVICVNWFVAICCTACF